MANPAPVTNVIIRPAARPDLAPMLEIYNEAVRNLTASYDYEPRTMEAQQEWFAEKQDGGYPVLVAELDETVVGWASLGPFRDRIGYRFTAEDSIYLRVDRRGQGIGYALLSRLINEARDRGYHTLIAGMDTESEASIRLHAKLGFVPAGLFQEVGFKFDRWLDVVFMQLRLE